MANAERVAPPVFSNDVTYKFWKNHIEMWTAICGVPQNEQGILVLLQYLTGNKKAEKAVSVLTTADLHIETALRILICKLDDAFQDEKAENTYSIDKKFIYLKKSSQMSMNEYILEFENLSYEMSSFNMTFLDTVLAF